MDLDRIKYVKNYIYKMANGTNPITDTPVADDEIINNIDISRCLFYVNDLLQKIIDNGGITNKGYL